MYGLINFRVINTDPGANTAFAPPKEWQGDYRADFGDGDQSFRRT
ncbi:hypothetical protein FEP37_05929 [Burkholderia multivorans]|nr:hypothetical protein [Burkholderia multivorans]MDR9060746.1 hypothetical protein [Burkholderia multivorans]MDR9125913.1 hypothetical protein [Burkholderia multivorans]MDR9137483.1 hypothetical protein [Burkholderia multivorans]